MEKIHYEERLSRNITRTYYTKNIYKKGTLISQFTEKQFQKLTLKNIDNYFRPQITFGHGVAEYFDVEKDIEFVKVITYTKTKEKIVKLK
jgi:hypothetical protein